MSWRYTKTLNVDNKLSHTSIHSQSQRPNLTHELTHNGVSMATPQWQFRGFGIGAIYQSGILEPKNHGIAKAGKRHLRSPSPITNPAQTPFSPLNHVLKCHSHMLFEHFQGWWLHRFPRQPVAMLGNPFHEENFHDIWSKPSLVQLEAISSHPATCFWGDWHPTHFNNFFQNC